MRLRTARRSQQLISLTPLVDVVFILLVFFMLASSFVDWRTVTVSAPASWTGGSGASDAMGVTLHADGSVTLGGTTTTLAGLADVFRTVIGDRTNAKAVLRVEKGAPLQAMVGTVEVLTAAGATDVSLIRRGNGSP